MINLSKKFTLLLITVLGLSIGSCKKDVQDNLVTEGNPAKVEAATINNPAGEDKVCGAIMVKDAAMQARKDGMEVKVREYIAQKSSMRIGSTDGTNSVVTVPVVFHVIYNLAEQNISDAQLNSQIDVLNKDFTATNSDISTVPSGFQSLIGNAGFQFVLAKRDPNGNATNGIIRKSTTVASFSSDGSVCNASMGGDNAWPATSYLNIWVCNKSGAAGYSSYPWSGSPSTDGIIIGYNYLGTTGTFTNNWSYLLGRTLTHEVGHWFGLAHIWGDATCGDDLVGDTPTQSAANGSCPTYPHMSSCSPNSNGDMFMSYMDYTYDACRTMFSVGQVSRMQGYLNTTRSSLLTSLGGVAPGGGTSCNVPGGLASSAISASGATFNWSSTGATSYNVHYKPSASSTWTNATSSSTTLAVSGLTASTAYEFQVQSNCSGSTSAFSSSSTFTTLATAPTCNVPSGLSASSVTSGSAVLNWASTGAASYNVMYKTSAGSTWSTVSSSSTSVNVSGLAASTTYVFQVQSNCGSSTSAYSSASSFTTLATAPTCNVPSGLSASSVTSGSAVLNWASTGAASYNVMYKTSAGSTWSTLSTSSTSTTISGLSASTTYVFQVQSNCGSSTSAYSSAASFTTLAIAPTCNVPSGLSASSVTSGSAVLNWASIGAASYYVMYKTSAGATWSTISTSSTSTTISGLSASTTYVFQVQSNCGSSTSAYSSASSFTTLATAPPACNVPSGLAAALITSNSAVLSWASTGAVSYNIMYKKANATTWTVISSSSNSFSISGLSANTVYQFQVQSVCSGSSSAYSSYVSFSTTGQGKGKKA